MVSSKPKKLPNGFGSIRTIKGGRARPYAVYLPRTKADRENGRATGQLLGCYASYTAAYSALVVYHQLPENMKKSEGERPPSVEESLSAILAGKKISKYDDTTFDEIYGAYYHDKFESGQDYSDSAIASARKAYNNCKTLHGRKFLELSANDLQAVLNSCPLGTSSLRDITKLLHGMYRYAMREKITDTDESLYIRINKPSDTVSGVPLSRDDLQILWQHKDEPDVGFILLMCYTGFRITAYSSRSSLKWDEDKHALTGGLKTKEGKGRTVPVPDFIVPFAHAWANAQKYTSGTLRKQFYQTLSRLGILDIRDSNGNGKLKHTPHDCRHTYDWICDRCGVDEPSKRMLMGHSLGNDVERRIYTHRSPEDLRQEVDKLRFPAIL